MKSNARRLVTGFLILSLWGGKVVQAQIPASSSPFSVMVCYPGGPIKAADARPALDSMVKVIESAGHFKPGSMSSQFTTNLDECRKTLAQNPPHFAIISLGLFLEYETTYNLTPVAQPNIEGKTADTYRILVKKGTFGNLDALQGKTLGGTHLQEPLFLQRIVLKNRFDPAKHFKLQPSPRALEALRRLNQGKLDAVIVNDQQYKSLNSLPFAKDLEPIFTSGPVPLMGVVANTKKSSPEDRARLTQALSTMCSDPKGKELCELFGVESFVPADMNIYKSVKALWTQKAAS